MKKILPVVLSVVLLLGLATAIVWAAPPDQGGFNLVPTGISFTPEVPYPGQPGVEFTIKYENQGTAAMPEGTPVEYRIVAEGIDDPLAEGEASVPAGLEVGASGEVKGSFSAPSEEGDYDLTVFLKTSEGENALPASLKVETALPPGLAQLFAGLGMFAAVMAIMAVGTEVVIESLKLLIGMKQKVTAMEALDQLKEELPGRLTALGADAESLEKVDALFKELDTTLEPVAQVVNVYEQIKDGHFGEAFRALKAIEQLEPGAAAAEKELTKLKEQAKLGIRSGFVVLRIRLPLSNELTDPIQDFLLKQIDTVTIETAAQLLETTVKKLQEIVLNHEPEWTAAWMQSQVDTLITQGRTGVMNLLEGKVLSTLRELGFEEATLGATKTKMVEALDSVESITREKTTTYVQAMRGLLMAVEQRRNLIQSPLRKIDRRLRDSDRLSLWGVLLGAGIAIVIIVLAFWPGLFVALLAKLGIVVAGLLIGALLGWIVSYLILGPSPDTQSEPSAQPRLGERVLKLTLGDFLKGIEWLFNTVMRREQDPSRFGKVDAKVEKRINDMDPTSVAGVLLEREDKHRDEEASRIRILRVISIFVGTILAYLLEIDAVELLDYAVPNIADKVNAVLLTGDQLKGVWPALTKDLTVGIILTGLAASAGSKFWRDLLGRLQTAREQAEEAARLVRRVRGMVGVEEE